MHGETMNFSRNVRKIPEHRISRKSVQWEPRWSVWTHVSIP